MAGHQQKTSPRPSPILERQVAALGELIDRVFEDPEVQSFIMELNREISRVHLAVAPATREKLEADLLRRLPKLADRMIEHMPELDAHFGRDALADYLLLLVAPDRHVGQIRFRGPVGYQGQPVHVLRDRAATVAFTQSVTAGQIWVNATQLTEELYRELWALISYQQQAEGLRTPGPIGRPAGSRSRPRQTLVELVRHHPEWDKATIYQEGLSLGAWDDDGPYAVDSKRNWARANRIMKSAQQS